MLLEARGVVEKAMGKESFEMSGYLVALGELWFHLSRFKEAERVFLEAEEMRRRLFGQAQEHTLGLRHILGYRAIEKVRTWLLEVWTRLGKLWDVERVLRRRLQVATRNEGEDSHRALQGMMQLGRCFMDQKRWEEAEGVYRKAIEARNRGVRFMEDAPQVLVGCVAVCWENMGRGRMRLGCRDGC
jgi:tetratricopeptide (TPR) repeat protein